jgi:hypothetical protein
MADARKRTAKAPAAARGTKAARTGDELADLAPADAANETRVVLEMQIGMFRRMLASIKPQKATGPVTLSIGKAAPPVADAKYGEEFVVGSSTLQHCLGAPQDAIRLTALSGDLTTFSLWVLPVKSIQGLSAGETFKCVVNARQIIDKLKNVDCSGTGTVVVTAGSIRFHVSSHSGCMSTHTFTVIDEVESHDTFIHELKQQSPESIRANVGGVSLKSTLTAMDTTESSAVGKIQLAGIFDKSDASMTLALTFNMETQDWNIYSGYVTQSDGALKMIDFRSRDTGARASAPPPDDDVMAAADRAMKEAKHSTSGENKLEPFEKASKEYERRLKEDPAFTPGTPMPLAMTDSAYNLVINETFNPSALLGLFKENVTELSEGVTLVFTKRKSKKDGSALVLVTPLGNGCIGLHMMSYCVNDDDDAQ